MNCRIYRLPSRPYINYNIVNDATSFKVLYLVKYLYCAVWSNMWGKVKNAKKVDFSMRPYFIVMHLKVKCTLVQALGLCTARTAHRGSRGIALPFHIHGTRRG